MLDRRSLLAGTSAAMMIAASLKPNEAAAQATRIVKIDPFAMDKAELALHPATQFSRLDDNSFQNFADGFRKFQGGHHSETVGTSHRDEFLKSKGLSATEDTNMSFKQAWEVLMEDPAYAAKTRLHMSNQHLMWDRARRAFHVDAERYLAAMEKTDKSGPGSLELNPDLDIPDYARHEIHSQPGGYVGDPFAGWIFHYALDVGFLEDYHPVGQPARGGNRHDELYIGLSQSLPLPADGKVRRILDIGCGTGLYTAAIKERFPDAEVWGIDAGGPMVRYAHYRAVQMNNDLHFAQRLAEDTKFPDGYFDIVTDHILLHEVTADVSKRIVAEMHRVLRPGGTFAHFDSVTAGESLPMPTTIPAKASIWWIHRYIVEAWSLEYLNLNLPDAMRQAGFEVKLSDPWVRQFYPGVLGVKQV